MISLSATIRPRESNHALDPVVRYLYKFRHLDVRTGGTMVHVPQIGPMLLHREPRGLFLQVVAANEAAAVVVGDFVEDLLRRTMLGGEYQRSFSLCWERMSSIPAALR
ncbi:MAG: hypothetical protein JWQ43_618 [Glaciihabitans sp.]|nr:hypothetical protein [Glaciihabitans sp.]